MKILIGLLAALGLGVGGYQATNLGDTGTVNTLNPWKVTSSYIQPRNATNGLQVNALANCNTIDTDADGKFSCGTDEGGTGGSWSTSTADYWAQNDLKLQELSDVQDPNAWGQLLMWTGSVWATTSTSSLGIAGVADGDWSTTSADYWETTQTARTADDLSDNTTTDLAEGTNLYYTDLRVGDYITASTTLCVFLTGSADLCDGVDATGTGGTGLATSTAIADTYVIYGTAPGTVGAESAFTYDDATDKLTVVNASTTYTSATTFFGNLTGLASLASALNANGSNCSAGSFPLGVNASGAVEDCTDAWTEAENTSAAYISRSGVSATYPISYNSGTGVFSWLGLSTSSAPSIGGLPYWTSSTALGTVATGTLTENVTGLEFNATGNLVGSAAILGITTGYGIPLTASTTNWNSFYDTPSGRITGGNGLTWSGNTLNFDGGDTPGGELGGTWASPTLDANALSLEELSDVTDAITETLGDLLYWTGTQWSDIATSSLNISTTNLVEGTNLFYTDARVGAYITGSSTLYLGGDLRVAGGDITLGSQSVFSGGDTASLNNVDAIDATTEATFEAALDTFNSGLTVGSFFALVNGASPTVDAAGEMALDTTDDQLILADSGGTARVFATDEFRVISVTLASTSVAFTSGQTLPALSHKDGLEITQYSCYVVGGTSKVINLTDGTNDTETITCNTTLTQDTDVATNDTFTAGELGYLELGATTGTVNYLHFEAWARITRE